MASNIPGLTLSPGSFVIPPYDPPGNNGVAISTNTIDFRTGIEIEVTLTNRAATSSFISPTSYILNLLVPTSTFPKASSTFWVCDNILRRSSTHSSSTNRWALQNMGYPCNNLAAPVVVLNYDNNRKAIGIATNYNRQLNFVSEFTNGNYAVSLYTNYQLGSLAQNDWFAPSETRSFKIWIQTAYNPNGVQTDEVVNLLKPYIDWHRSAFPNYGNSSKTKVDGRLCGYYLAQSEAPLTQNTTNDNLRKYWAFNPTTKATVSSNGFTAPNVHPETCSGWEELLDASVPVQTLLAKGYVGIVLWAITGFADTGEDLLPNIFTNLPTNLRNTIDQIRKWSRKTGLKVYIYCGYGGMKVQPAGAWNTTPVTVAQGTYNAAGFNVNTAIRQTISSTYDNILKQNFDDGIFNYTDGVILDASPDIASYPWFATIANRWGPLGKVIGQETYKSDLNCALSPNCYFTESTYLGRCPLLDAISPGYQPKVIISSFTDFASNRANFEARVRAIEESGGCCIILGTDATQLPNIPSYMSKTQKRLGLKLGRKR